MSFLDTLLFIPSPLLLVFIMLSASVADAGSCLGCFLGDPSAVWFGFCRTFGLLGAICRVSFDGVSYGHLVVHYFITPQLFS